MKKLTKSLTNKKLCGVCGGLGEAYGMDVTMLRLIFAVGTIFFIFPIIAYIALATIIPEEVEEDK